MLDPGVISNRLNPRYDLKSCISRERERGGSCGGAAVFKCQPKQITFHPTECLFEPSHTLKISSRKAEENLRGASTLLWLLLSKGRDVILLALLAN